MDDYDVYDDDFNDDYVDAYADYNDSDYDDDDNGLDIFQEWVDSDPNDERYISSSSSNDSLDCKEDIDLPVATYKDDIIEAVKTHQVVIITGKTGCGKTTKIPQYLLEAGLNNEAMIGITQPRRVCAVSIATRIAKERKCTLGREVGYQIRFDTRLNSSTKIKVMTEGILLNDFRSDRRLREYGVIIIDEAHERSTNCEILLGLLKDIVAKRRDLRVIICSATINAEAFLNYFPGSTIVKVKGRPYPVEVIYVNKRIQSLVSLIMECLQDQRGDILVFIAGVSTIIATCKALDELIQSKNIANVDIFPLYAGIGVDEQRRIMKPANGNRRKVILSTNIAESSVTIEGVKIVIDTGLHKEFGYIPRRDLDTIEDAPISKAQAEQRRGRAGRTCPGKCYRLYSEEKYSSLSEDFTPAVARENLADMYLAMLALDLDPWTFTYLDRPKDYMLRYAEEELRRYSLTDDGIRLTDRGRRVADLPIGLRLGMVIEESTSKESFFTTLCICALLTEEYVFLRPWRDNDVKRAKNRQTRFDDEDGDHFTLLNLYKEWKVQDNQKKWCYRYFVSLPLMKEIDMMVEQICQILRRRGIMFGLSFVDERVAIKKSFLNVYYNNISNIIRKRIVRCSDKEEFKVSQYSHTTLPSFKNALCLFIKGVKIKKHKSANLIMLLSLKDIQSSFKSSNSNPEFDSLSDIEFDFTIY